MKKSETTLQLLVDFINKIKQKPLNHSVYIDTDYNYKIYCQDDCICICMVDGLGDVSKQRIIRFMYKYRQLN